MLQCDDVSSIGLPSFESKIQSFESAFPRFKLPLLDSKPIDIHNFPLSCLLRYVQTKTDKRNERKSSDNITAHSDQLQTIKYFHQIGL